MKIGRRPITSWKQLVSLPKGSELLELVNDGKQTNEYITSHVTMKKDMIEMFYKNEEKENFKLEEKHYDNVVTHGNSELFLIERDFFDTDMFEIS